ncbi:MAG: FAD-containing oxidoreductase [Novosphingobium sp.]|nr:FAD-containing oxidoreductase [Novosphingobium sp.]
MTRRFDAIVIGAGQAGPALAGRLSDAGQTVALVERGELGGTCVNTGCKPTKTLVASAYAAHLARRAADYGVIAPGVGIDFARVMARADRIIQDSRANLAKWIEGMEHCTLFRGAARFEGPRTIRVGDALLEAEHIYLNVGGRPAIPEMPGVHDVPVLTNVDMLQLKELPEHLVVVGGSYIGLEFAQMFRRFGAQVTVVEKAPRLIAREDEDVSAAVQALLEAEGIAVRTAAECISFAPAEGGKVSVGVDCECGEPAVTGTHALLAVGRAPNTGELGLDKAGVELDARGYIKVDDRLETNVPGIWALGDCNGRGAFTHTAYNDFEIVAENRLDGADRKVSDRIPCYALFVDPPLGRCGMGEAEARAAGHEILVGRRDMTRVGRAVEKDESFGFMKIVVDAKTRAILGATVFGTGGDEAIHSVIDFMATGAPIDALRRTVHIHPTVAELLPTIAGELQPA